MDPYVSFVITSRNEQQETLLATIAGILRTSDAVPLEIIVVDDGSSPPVSPLSPEVRLTRNAVPVGVAHCRRYGASLARSSVLCWLDAHMSFDSGWLEEMLTHVDSCALLCAAFCNYERTIPHCYGADFIWNGVRDYTKGQYPGFELRHRTNHPGQRVVDVPMVVGACYMMRRDAYEHCGGFSPFFRIWGVDEQDISLRCWMTGLSVRCITGARVGHLWRPQFPYPVQFEHLEFNQLMTVRTVLQEENVERLAAVFDPLPPPVQQWLREVNSDSWRALIQARRALSDGELFRRFVPSLVS